MVLTGIILASVPGRPALGWGRLGHRVAGAVAEARLSPAARAAVRDLLEPGETLADASNWADEHRRDVPDSGPWHYVNVPITESRYDARFCDRRGCVVSKIAEHRRVLADPSASKEDRRLALRLVVHLVQDTPPAAPRRRPRRPRRQRPPAPVLRRGFEPAPGLGLGPPGARRRGRAGAGPLSVGAGDPARGRLGPGDGRGLGHREPVGREGRLPRAQWRRAAPDRGEARAAVPAGQHPDRAEAGRAVGRPGRGAAQRDLPLSAAPAVTRPAR